MLAYGRYYVRTRIHKIQTAKYLRNGRAYHNRKIFPLHGIYGSWFINVSLFFSGIMGYKGRVIEQPSLTSVYVIVKAR